MAAKLRLTTI